MPTPIDLLRASRLLRAGTLRAVGESGPHPAASRSMTGAFPGLRLAGVAVWAALALCEAPASQVSAPVPASVGRTSTAARLDESAQVAEARQLLKKGRVRQALSLLEALPQPISADAVVLQAEALYEQGATARSLESLEAHSLSLRQRGDALGLRLRCYLRLGRDADARRLFDRYSDLGRLQRTERHAELFAALGSAAFKYGDAERAAELYQAALRLDPEQPDALLRLGSGLGPERPAGTFAQLTAAIQAFERGDLDAAETLLRKAREAHPNHPAVLRIHGELIDRRRAEAWVEGHDQHLALIRARARGPYAVDKARRMLPDFDSLSGERLRVVERTLALFADHLPLLAVRRARHDLLALDERSTAAIERRNLAGTRTFDGRLWDDVRGLGGLRAATGIEAIDDAAVFGFDTFAHEVAHQVHFFALDRQQKDRIDELYRIAIEEQLCLDGYAASSAAEYFGQGVEAFVSLCKRPAGPRTHGHTRFELARRDPALHAFIESLASYDPLAQESPGRIALLRAAAEVAAADGRTEDAALARRWMVSDGR